MRRITFVIAALACAANAWSDDDSRDFIRGPVICQKYDGSADDLLTAGLGKSGLRIDAAAPGFVDPAKPTAAELRRRAIYNNYRALVDVTPNGGYGRLYGPNIDVNGGDTLGEGKIAGEECLAFADDGKGDKNVTLMVQIPASFDPRSPCIVTAASSGSRGIYGAIGTAGEAGLKLGCAVAYTDKGTGMGTHDLQNDTVNLINGLRASADNDSSNFTANISNGQRYAFNSATPNRFAFKHAHSQQNPEADWGRNVLQSIKFAFWLLNEPERFGGYITKRNTIVIASSVSNGAGAALLAAEQDRDGLIDGIAVAEPMIQPQPRRQLRIKRGGELVAAQSKALFDYTTLANLYQVCASQASSLVQSPALGVIDPVRAKARCAALKAAGLLESTEPSEQPAEALKVLRDAGWEPESDLLHASHWAFATPAIGVTYANTYGRFSVLDNICGFSFGATDTAGNPTAANAGVVAQIFANGNGIPPTGPGINIINNDSVGGPKLDSISVSPGNVLDYNAPGALCLRALESSKRVRQGIERVRADGNLHGKPAIIVHGRADTLVPVNHASRAYVGLNAIEERKRSKLRYYEVTNAQHFEAFLSVPGYDTRFIPLHYYFVQAVKLMHNHLKNGDALPPSQVVRTTPRGGTPGLAPAITVPTNVRPIPAEPAEADLIRMRGNTLHIPADPT